MDAEVGSIRLERMVAELGQVEDRVVFRRWDDPPAVGSVRELHQMRNTVFAAARENGVPVTFNEVNRLSREQLDELLGLGAVEFVRLVVAIKRAMIEERRERR